jgi:RNA polymerase sigma factor, sigma-70 family
MRPAESSELVKDVSSLIHKALDSRHPLTERHEAFAELVTRFQDMAFGCAYAVLGDFYLAEDAAQEAFITAWQNLSQLRVPEAFSGWLRRIVLTRCNRLTRGQRLPIVPLDVGMNTPSPGPDPQSSAEQRDLSAKVLAEIQGLPEKERLVTTLFYVNGYTHTDIGEFLEVPLTTVNKRLYSARQRLKKSATVEMFRDDLKARRPSRNRAFAEKVNARLRPFGEPDWPAISDIVSGTEQSTEDSEVWLRRRRQFNDARYVRRQYVAEHARTGQLLGYGAIEQSIYLPRYKLFLVIEPQWLQRGVGDLLITRLMDDLREVDAVTVTFQDYESSNAKQELLKAHGFTETRHLIDLRLDLTPAALTGWSATVDRVKAGGISISTLQKEREQDPRYVEKLYELTSTLELDDPARDPFSPPAYYEREAKLWLEQKYVLPNGYFIAKDGDKYVGMTSLNLIDGVPGEVQAGFTGVRRDYRRQGMATALKVSAIEWASEQGYKAIRTLNQPIHSSLLTINEKLGFQRRSSYVTLERCIRAVAETDRQVYDNYAGRYQDVNGRPDLILTVKNEGGRLTVECIGQKVELFPESQTSFFCKPFYGEFDFITDEDGRVIRLDSRVRGLNQPTSVLHAKKIE